MPVTQDRLLRLIEAAETFLRRDALLRAHIATTCARAATGTITLSAALADISAEITLAPEYHPAEVIIREERMHYNITSKRNLQEKLRMRARRAGLTFDPGPRETRYPPSTTPQHHNHNTKQNYSHQPIITSDPNEGTNDDLDLSILGGPSASSALPEIELTPKEQAEADRILAEMRRIRQERGES